MMVKEEAIALREGERTMFLDEVFQSFPRLETARLILRELSPSDAGSVFAILSDDHVTRYYDDDPFMGVSQARSQIEAWAGGYRNGRCIRWGIALNADNVIIGSCGYYGFHGLHMRGAIGYELARSFWRQGIMTEALSAIIGFGFEEIGLNRIQATVMPENIGSVKLLEKLGFSSEGILRAYEMWGGKGYVDLLMFSLLRDEYDRQ
jgi:ribosomal-protein-alanine N-acetyltransferase